MESMESKFWLWGYTLETIPGTAFFVPGETRCSLETAAHYLGCDGVFWMNGLHDLDAFNDRHMKLLKEFPSVICGLTHIETNGPGKGGWRMLYKEAAARVAALAKRYPNIKGAIIDDFLHVEGPSRDMTPDELHEVNAVLKADDPSLMLYVVHYHVTQAPGQLIPFQEDFDGMTTWAWNSTNDFWNSLYEKEIREMRQLYPNKRVIQGLFLNAYGDLGDNAAQPMDQLELQCERISPMLDEGVVDGWCALQNGHLCRESHRRQVMFLKAYWEWYRGTRTVR